MSELVIFDCDGVLVDSEVLVIEIEAEMLTALGAPLTPDDITRNFVGLSDSLMAEALRRDWGVELPPTFDEERRQRVAARFDEALVPIAGIDVVLRGLQVPACVASSSEPDRIAHSLTLTGLIDAFDGRLYSASMVARGKPAPDLFWHAAASLRVHPVACVVVEDSPHGVEAGCAAGMHVIGFTAGGHCPEDQAERLTAAGAHRVVATSEALGHALAQLT